MTHSVCWYLGRLGAVVTLAVLTACGSSIPLNEVPVQDAQGKPVQALTQVPISTASAMGRPQAVQSVDLTAQPTGASGPTSVRVIYFDFDSYDLRPEFRATLETHARFLGADKARRVNLEGHTDERGGREYNLALGQKRAEAVRRALSLLGVADAQMDAVSFGKEKPAATGNTEEVMAKNRRVELTYR